MAKKKLGISIAIIIGFCLFTGLLQFSPISISFGKRNHANSDLQNMPLQPNGMYLVYVKKPMALPDDMELVTEPWTGMAIPCEFAGTRRGAGFVHDGKRKDDDKKKCMGTITILLQDDGRIKYKCLHCSKMIPDRDSKSKKEEYYDNK